MKIDYSLYLVTDRKSIGERTLAEAVEQALLGGCSMVQLREKECSALDFYRQALCVKRITEKYQVPLILNDRADIALAVGGGRRAYRTERSSGPGRPQADRRNQDSWRLRLFPETVAAGGKRRGRLSGRWRHVPHKEQSGR